MGADIEKNAILVAVLVEWTLLLAAFFLFIFLVVSFFLLYVLLRRNRYYTGGTMVADIEQQMLVVVCVAFAEAFDGGRGRTRTADASSFAEEIRLSFLPFLHQHLRRRSSHGRLKLQRELFHFRIVMKRRGKRFHSRVVARADVGMLTGADVGGCGCSVLLDALRC